MFSLRPGKDVTNKYQRKVVFLSQLPFGNRWKRYIKKEDIKLFENYQYRIRIWYLSVIVPFFLFFVYLIAKLNLAEVTCPLFSSTQVESSAGSARFRVLCSNSSGVMYPKAL
jgi:hypothetical protein